MEIYSVKNSRGSFRINFEKRFAKHAATCR